MRGEEETNKVQAEQIAGIRRDLVRVETAVQAGFIDVKQELKSLHDAFVLKEVYREDKERLSKDLEKKADNEQFEEVKDNQRKTMWLVIASVITTGMGLLYAAAKSHLP